MNIILFPWFSLKVNFKYISFQFLQGILLFYESCLADVFKLLIYVKLFNTGDNSLHNRYSNRIQSL